MLRELYRRLLDSLHIKGRDVTVFLLSLLLASSVWLLHNLSLNYSDLVSIPVTAQSNIEGHSAYSSNSCLIVARCRTTGFNLIRNHYSYKVKTVFFNQADLTCKGGEEFTISSNNLNTYFKEIFGDDVSLESFVTQDILFRFPYENHKKVPVQPVVMIGYKPQYMASGTIATVPDSVTVYGEPFRLDKIDRVLTRTIEHENVKSSLHGAVMLEKAAGVRYSVDQVNYSLPVTRFVEVRSEVKVVARGVPAGRDFSIYPSSAQVVYRCAFPMTEDPTFETGFHVDYKEFQNSINGRCVARINHVPDGVIDYQIYPEVFECVESVRK